jgi:hypothetical protein
MVQKTVAQTLQIPQKVVKVPKLQGKAMAKHNWGLGGFKSRCFFLQSLPEMKKTDAFKIWSLFFSR